MDGRRLTGENSERSSYKSIDAPWPGCSTTEKSKGVRARAFLLESTGILIDLFQESCLVNPVDLTRIDQEVAQATRPEL